MSQTALSLTQRLAWWTITSRVAGCLFRFARVLPECLAAVVVVVIVFYHPSMASLVAAAGCLPILVLVMARGVWFLGVVGAYLKVCNPAFFSRVVVEDAILTIIDRRAWTTLLPIYGKDQLRDDIRAAEDFIHGSKSEVA